MSEHLPFLVVHGALVWKTIAAASACLGPVALMARARRRHRARVRREIGLLRAGESPLAIGKVALTGTLRGGSATTIEQPGTIADRRGDAMWLDVGGERVELVGPLHVEAGASVRTAWWWPGRLGGEVGTRWLEPTTAHTIRDGDEAFVLGVLEAAATDDAGYRESSRMWRLHANEGGAIAMSATASDERPMPRSPLLHVFVGLGCAAVTLFVLLIVGAIAMSTVGNHEVYGLGGPRSAAIVSPRALAIAAAMPIYRSDALAQLSWDISEALTITSERVELQAEVDEQLGNCAAQTYERAGWFDEALASAERCGRPELVMQALIDLGRYDEAWAMHLVMGEVAPAGLAIATGHWADAADAVSLNPGYDRCRAALFRAYASGHDTFELAEQVCPLTVVLAAAPGSHWAAQLGRPRSVTDLALDRVELALGVRPLDQALVANDLIQNEVELPWLARIIAPAENGEATWHAMRALDDVELGDLAAARDELAHAELRDDVRLAIGNVIAMREGTALGDATRGEPSAMTLRRGEPPPFQTVAPCEKQVVAGFQGSDAGPLVYALERCRADDWRIDELAVAVLPRFTAHRAELAAVLHAQPPWQPLGENAPALLDAAAFRRDAARLAGDTDAAARWQTIVQRHAKVLEDPRKAVAFLLLHD